MFNLTFDHNFNIGFNVAPEAIEFLQSDALVNDKIGVIAVAGKYRTGKSFLLNRILLNKMGNKSGFGVGPTINPCTKVSKKFIPFLYSKKFWVFHIFILSFKIKIYFDNLKLKNIGSLDL